jgi:uncharacterized linocin/CFP29 family protein
MNNSGRDKIWTQGNEPKNWTTIDTAVNEEVDAVRVAKQFLKPPPNGYVSNVSVVPSLIIDPETMTIDDTLMTPLVEMWVEFTLTYTQLEHEGDGKYTLNLARSAANSLALAEDVLMFNGEKGVDIVKKFKPRVEFRHPLHVFTGLLEAADEKHTIHVKPIQEHPLKYGANTFEEVRAAIDLLSGDGKGDPYAIVLNRAIHSDTYASQNNTFIYAAEVIKPLATAGYFSTSGLPPQTGLVISLKGGSMDRIAAQEPITQYTQMDDDGFYHFRVYECFALRLMDRGTVIKLIFDEHIK